MVMRQTLTLRFVQFSSNTLNCVVFVFSAVLENHHAALTFKLTTKDQSVNIFKNLDR